MLISRNKVKRLTFGRPAASGLTQMVKLKIALAIFLTLYYITPAACGLTQELKVNLVNVDAGHEKNQISRDIYGHFSEHLGRCIYGGFWVGKDSDIPNINGYRKDVVEAFK